MRGLAVFSGARIPHAFNCIADPFYDSPSDTLLLLHGEGVNGGTVFTDSSPYNHSVTIRTGSPTTSTAQVKVGSASLSVPALAALQIRMSWEAIADNWTWESWYYRVPATDGVGFYNPNGGGFVIQLIDPGNLGNYELGVVIAGVTVVKGTTTVPLNTWTHLAVSVSKTAGTYTIRVFVNGTLETTTTSTNAACSMDVATAYIGALNISSFFGAKTYLDEFRVVRQCLYTASFTPSVVPFTATGTGACTSLMLHADSAVDSSVSPKAISLTGSCVVSSDQSKFGTSSFYIPNPGSSSVTGVAVSTGTTDFNFGFADFTLEMWAYRESNANSGTLFFINVSAGLSLVVDTSGNITLNYVSSGGTQSGINPSTVFPLATWCFVVVQRRGTNFEFYFNGVLKNTTAITGGVASTLDATNAFYIGRRSDAGTTAVWGGYVDEIRVTRGVARYTADFTPDSLPNCNSTHGAP